MDDATLGVILGRFDKLDAKIDDAIQQHSDLRTEVATIRTQLNPLVKDATFRRRVQYFGHVLSGSIGAGIMLAIHAIWPHTVPPPSVLHK